MIRNCDITTSPTILLLLLLPPLLNLLCEENKNECKIEPSQSSNEFRKRGLHDEIRH